MNIRELMEFASGEVNFSILKCLHDKPLFAGDLSSRLNVHIRTIRVHLHRLRKREFVDYTVDGKKHLYHIKTPFESLAHEIILSIVALGEPVKKRGEDDTSLQVDPDSELQKETQKNYWLTLVKGLYKVMVHQGSIGQQKKLREELQEIENRIETLE